MPYRQMGPSLMKKPTVSLITPTHRADHLLRLYKSIYHQTSKDFEWIIIPNGEVDLTFLPRHKWIKIVPYTNSNLNIGALKYFGFCHAQGELLAEVDHDDELTPNCVEVLIQNKNKANFLYSNNLVLTAEGEPYTWGPGYGWRFGTYLYNNVECRINIAFPPLPGNFGWQWWAPNHIRVWNKNFYHSIGGHDINLKACDDGDILCRTMIHGTIYHINDVLYIYYLHPNNSHADKSLNKWIQNYTHYMHSHYILHMTNAWRKNCGYKKCIENEIYNYRDGEVGLIITENLHTRNNIEQYMKQAYNVLASGGIMLVTNPLSIEQDCSTVTEKQIPFWDGKQYSVDGIAFKANGVHIENNTVKAYFTKINNEVHAANPWIDYFSLYKSRK